jgi:hypothetical protein
MDPEMWNSYFKFCFERNPYDRAISLYFWRHRGLASYANINEYLLEVSAQYLSNWDLYNESGFLKVDFLGRYEHLAEEFREVCRKIGIDGDLKLPWLKHNVRPGFTPYQELLSNEVRQRIETVCAREIRLLGYQW